MIFARTPVVSRSNDLASSDNDRTDHRIGARPTGALARQAESQSHISFIEIMGHSEAISIQLSATMDKQ